MKTLPTLYKKNSTGKIQQWIVGYKGDQVITTHGQMDGKQQTTSDTVKGKNTGKKNETTANEQAAVKAKQLWDKKIKSRYVKSLDDAEEGVSSVVGFKPMLAFVFEKKLKHVKWPGIAQAKLDGLRCLGTITEDKVVLTYRKGGVITSLPHLVDELEDIFCPLVEAGQTIKLDGELYNHKYKDDFNTLKSYIKRDDVHPNHKEVQWHVYDHVDHNYGYDQRMGVINDLVAESKYLKQVPYEFVDDKKGLINYFHKALEMGYEGAMYRHPDMGYDNHPERSVGLLKVKVFEDAEFEVVGVMEGSGKLQGTAGSIICLTPEGFEFKAKLKAFEDSKGKRIESKEDYQARCLNWFENIDDYIGKMLLVKFQGKTPKKFDEDGKLIDGYKPRFPNAIRVRDY